MELDGQTDVTELVSVVVHTSVSFKNCPTNNNFITDCAYSHLSNNRTQLFCLRKYWGEIEVE
jgi:hypothetical protein